MIKMPGDRLEKKLIDDIICELNTVTPKPKLRDKFKIACRFILNKFKKTKR